MTARHAGHAEFRDSVSAHPGVAMRPVSPMARVRTPTMNPPRSRLKYFGISAARRRCGPATLTAIARHVVFAMRANGPMCGAGEPASTTPASSDVLLSSSAIAASMDFGLLISRANTGRRTWPRPLRQPRAISRSDDGAITGLGEKAAQSTADSAAARR